MHVCMSAYEPIPFDGSEHSVTCVLNRLSRSPTIRNVEPVHAFAKRQDSDAFANALLRARQQLLQAILAVSDVPQRKSSRHANGHISKRS